MTLPSYHGLGLVWLKIHGCVMNSKSVINSVFINYFSNRVRVNSIQPRLYRCTSKLRFALYHIFGMNNFGMNNLIIESWDQIRVFHLHNFFIRILRTISSFPLSRRETNISRSPSYVPKRIPKEPKYYFKDSILS